MKFDYCIGNPPYQETKGGTKNVDIWPDFVIESTKIANIACMIHPGRWCVAKKSMLKTRDTMVSNGLKLFKLYTNSDNIFPTLRGIDGGVAITMFEQNYSDKITFAVDSDNTIRIYDINNKILLNKYEEEIYTKAFANIDTDNNMSKYVLGNAGSLGSKELGYNKWDLLQYVQNTPDGLLEPIKVYTNDSLKLKTGKYIWGYIEKSKLLKYPDVLFRSKKILLSKIGGAINPNGVTTLYNKYPQICDANSTTQNHFFIYPDPINNTDRQTDRQIDRQTDRQTAIAA